MNWVYWTRYPKFTEILIQPKIEGKRKRKKILFTDTSVILKLGMQLEAVLSQDSGNQMPRVVAY